MKRFARILCFALVISSAAKFSFIPAVATEISAAEMEEMIAYEETMPVTDSEDAVETVPAMEETTPEDTVIIEENVVPDNDVESSVTEQEMQLAEAETVLYSTNIPLYYQTDYPYTPYGNGTVKTSGCGITSLAMVATYMTGHEYLPDELAGYFGGRAENNVKRLEYASDKLQLPWERAENWHVALQALQDGKVVILLLNEESAFTDSQHFIVLTGLNSDGRVMVHDPNEDNYSKWELQHGFADGFLETDMTRGYSGAWIYDPAAMPEIPFIYSENGNGESRYAAQQLSWDDLNLLAKVVWVEARGESFDGQQAVAEVVLNRMLSENFPQTLHAVVYAENQFRSVPYLEDAEPTQIQYEAIKQAIKGPYVLPTDVVFFATYPENENVWGQIGGHIFCSEWQ